MTWPVLPIISSTPVTTGRRRAFIAKPSTTNMNAAVLSVAAAMVGQLTPKLNDDVAGIEQEDRADDEGDDPADPEHQHARGEDLGDHQGNAQHDQRQPGVADRQDRQRRQRHQQADPADDAGEDEAGVPDFEQDSVEADEQQQVGDVRVGDDGNGARAPVRRQRLDRNALGRQPALLTFDRDAPAVDRGEQIVDVVGDDFDDFCVERLARRHGRRVAHRLLGEVAGCGRAAAPTCGDRPRRR